MPVVIEPEPIVSMNNNDKARQEPPPTEYPTPFALVNKQNRKPPAKEESIMEMEVTEFSTNNGNGSGDPGHKATADDATRSSYYYYSGNKNNRTAQLQQWYFQQLKETTIVTDTKSATAFAASAPGCESPLSGDESLSCLAFNNDGNMLATGNKAGQISIFQKNPRRKDNNNEDHYLPCTTFQSHSSEFDYLKSISICEGINKVTWLRQANSAHFLLATNDKTIKLWKLAEKTTPYSVDDDDWNIKKGEEHPKSITRLRFPKVIRKPPPTNAPQSAARLEPTLRRDYIGGHTYNINSISLSSDQETYLSADDLQLNLWNLDITSESFNIVDLKPASMEELTEVITTATFHPISSHLFAFGSSKGLIRLCDLRTNSTCDNHAKLFSALGDSIAADPLLQFQRFSFFSEIISSLSSVNFSHCGTYVGARDYLSVKVWDTRMESTGRGPIECYPCNDYLQPRLGNLYEHDLIFDKFDFCWAPADKGFCTGSYGNILYFVDRQEETNKQKGAAPMSSRVDCDSSSSDVTSEGYAVKVRKIINMKQADNGRVMGAMAVASAAGGKTRHQKKLQGILGEENLQLVEIDPNSMDFFKKLQHLVWHPAENLIAGADGKDLVLFTDKK